MMVVTCYISAVTPLTDISSKERYRDTKKLEETKIDSKEIEGEVLMKDNGGG